MTDLMTAFPVILAQLSCPGDQQASGALFHFHVHGWFCFLVISLLTMSTRAISNSDIKDLQTCVMNLHKTIQKSDAMLYTPFVDNAKGNCSNSSLRCYILELAMVLHEAEEEQNDPHSKCIYGSVQAVCDREGDCPTACRQCEAYSLQNITIFLDRLKDFLEIMASIPEP